MIRQQGEGGVQQAEGEDRGAKPEQGAARRHDDRLRLPDTNNRNWYGTYMSWSIKYESRENL